MRETKPKKGQIVKPAAASCSKSYGEHPTVANNNWPAPFPIQPTPTGPIVDLDHDSSGSLDGSGCPTPVLHNVLPDTTKRFKPPSTHIEVH